MERKTYYSIFGYPARRRMVVPCIIIVNINNNFIGNICAREIEVIEKIWIYKSWAILS